MKRNTAKAVLVLLVLGLASFASAQKSTVLRVLVVKTDNPAAYAEELAKGQEIMKKLGVPAQLRVWQARFAGPEAGTIVVSIEFPSLAEFAAGETKLNASSDYQTWLKGLDKIRKIVSDSLYKEL